MITTEVVCNKPKKHGVEKYIFNCEAYRLDGSNWVRLDKVFIDNQFDCKCYRNITKLKIKGEKGFKNTFVVKISIKQKHFFYSMAQELQLHWLIHVIQTRVSEAVQVNFASKDYINVCSGTIYRKSGFLGNWEKAHVAISQDGLAASKDENSKMDLKITKAREIWTRFQLIEDKSFFVFKLRDFFKYQFGVPVESISKWTKAFYSLIHFD